MVADGYASIETAPTDGNGFLAYGKHVNDSGKPGGHRKGDHWWAIIQWDIWREPHQWVFGRDGKPLSEWGTPTHWMPLKIPLSEWTEPIWIEPKSPAMHQAPLLDLSGNNHDDHELDELLEDARMAASTDWEEELVADLIEKRKKYGSRFMVTAQQEAKLRQIVGEDHLGDGYDR